MQPISEHQVPFGAEDKFLIVSIRNAEKLCPGINDAAVLKEAIEVAKPFLGDLIPLFDLRGLPKFYNDVEIFIDEVGGAGAHVLINNTTAAELDLCEKHRRGLKILTAKGKSYKAHPFDLSEFRGSNDPVHDEDPISDVAQDLLVRLYDDQIGDLPEINDLMTNTDEFRVPTLAEMRRILRQDYISRLIYESFGRKLACGITAKNFAQSIPLFFQKMQSALEATENVTKFGDDHDIMTFYLRTALIHAFLKRLHHNSLLVEFVMTSAGEQITCIPYHGKALNQIECPKKSSILIGRPAIIAQKTNAILSEEIQILESLINEPATREKDIQKFLENHPMFLKGLNYSNIYPQLVLQRDDGTSLRPDFILEPFDDGWCDILDIKLPSQSVIVGKKDRSTLAAGIHAVSAQLREYAAYFEQERYCKWVREKYGLRLYRPRLIAIVGRDMRQMDTTEIRRAMTAYTDLQIMTFDQLIKHAESRLLI